MSRASALLQIVLVAVAATSLGATSLARSGESDVERLQVQVLDSYPHDRSAFTQGLLWHEGSLYESTGLYGESTLRRVDPTSGRVLERFDLDSALFGEGLVLVDDRLIQLTWKEGLALVYDVAGLAPIDQLTYTGEGWGLAWDGTRLIMSDGTPRLTFRDPETFEELGSVTVTLDGTPLSQLNELEMVDGVLYANVLSDVHIYRIDPDSGKVLAVIDTTGMLSFMERLRTGVLNGIAYEPESESFWITGKNWSRIFQVRFVPAKETAKG